MNFKVALVAGAVALSAQTASAATDTSCNPFLSKGNNCRAAAVAFDRTALRAALRSSGFSASKSSGARSNRGQQGLAGQGGLGRLLESLMAKSLQRAVDLDGPVDIVQVIDLSDEGPRDGEDNGNGPSSVPLPAAGFLLLAGLGGLAVTRRKKS